MFERQREWWEETSVAGKVVAALLTLLVLAFLSGIAYISSIWRETEVPAELPVVHEAPVNDRDFTEEFTPYADLSTAGKRILNKHFESLGGRASISRIRSLRIEGIIELEEELQRDLLVLKKGGDHLRLSLSGPEATIVMAISPEDAWQSIGRAGRLLEVKDMDPKEKLDLSDSMDLVTELLLAPERGWSLRYLGNRDFSYKVCHAFEVEHGDGHTIRFFLDPKTFHDIGREEVYKDEDGEVVVMRRYQSDFEKVDGFTFPKTVIIRENEEVVQKIMVESVSVNAGILETAFTRPAFAGSGS
ncbi:MAG: hypothetical protein GVY10_01355 [Verrucomicrobia bacterium]|jgi:hypothetical protein|nr:hypothetical protein [Verrucomicrobiota bacterium]